MSSRFSLLALLSLLMSLAYLDSRHGSPFGIDAVSAVTPGRVSVVGAVALEETDAALTAAQIDEVCLLYTSPSPRDRTRSRMPSSA